jgi:hypothetical protein
MDDQPFWLDAVMRQLRLWQTPRRRIEVLPRTSVREARDVVEGEDRQMKALARQGCGLDGVILDLMMDGGNAGDVQRWLEGVSLLAKGRSKRKATSCPATIPSAHLDEIGRCCPALPVGRLAADRGAKVVILTNCGKFLREDRLDAATEQRLIMEASGASAYILKTDNRWLDRLRDALGKAIGTASP